MLIEESAETMMSTVIAGWRRQRWQKGTRYYEVLLHQDLWGAWIVTRVWGRRSSPLGRVWHSPCGSYADGLSQVRQVQQRRTQRGYASVDDDPLS